MKKILYILLSLSSVLFHHNTLAQEPFTVVIDPGHGGFDPGALANNVTEKSIVLAYGLKIGEILTQSNENIKVIYTRKTDKFVPLHERAAVANQHHAQLFISVHTNYYSTSSVYGFETFIMGMHNTEENLNIARKENAVILIEDNYEKHYEGFDINSSESYIIFDLMQEEQLLKSAELAILVNKNIPKYTTRKNRGIRQAGFLVLKETNVPSILLELGYISNISEVSYLQSIKGKDEICKAIAHAIIQYKNTYTVLEETVK